MDRQKITEKFGALEEQLERLDRISLSNENMAFDPGAFRFGESSLIQEALDTLKQVQDAVTEQNRQKSLPVLEFLKKVASILAREAAKEGVPIALSCYGTGRISIEMAEVTMGAILATLRCTLKSQKEIDSSQRSRFRLFRTRSVYIELHSASSELHFSVIGDGVGFTREFLTEGENGRMLQRIQTHICRNGGWLSYQSLPKYGSLIEFKIPMPQARFESVILRSGGVEILIPSHCVAEIRENASPDRSLEAVTFGEHGFRPYNAKAKNESVCFVRVAVADFQFWISCEAASSKVRTRKFSTDGFVEEDSWFKQFGLYLDGEVVKILPLVTGEELMAFHLEQGGEK